MSHTNVVSEVNVCSNQSCLLLILLINLISPLPLRLVTSQECTLITGAGGFHGGGWGSSGSLGSLASSCGSGSRAGEDGVSGGLCAFGCTTGACAEAPTPVPRLRPPDRAAILGIV